jgi:hypothetical protein
VAQLVVQYQMPREQTHWLPLASHCDSPCVLQAVPMAGSDATVEQTGTGAVPPVALPPVTTPPVATPPDATPPVIVHNPPLALPPDAVPPVRAPPLPVAPPVPTPQSQPQ